MSCRVESFNLHRNHKVPLQSCYRLLGRGESKRRRTTQEAREVGAAVQGAASPCSAAPDPNATEGAAPVDMEARHGRGSQGGTCWGALLAQSDGSGCTPNFKTGIGAYLIGVRG